jgi:hypothetical protein
MRITITAGEVHRDIGEKLDFLLYNREFSKA